MKHRTQRGNAGVTLLELLVALDPVRLARAAGVEPDAWQARLRGARCRG